MTLDGIPVGTLRSNMEDTKVSAEQWCKVFGHKLVLDALSSCYYCKSCFKTEKEINGEEEARTGQTAGN